MGLFARILTNDISVIASDREVIRHVYQKMDPVARRDPHLRQQRREVIRECLKEHHQGQELYEAVTKKIGRRLSA